MADPVSDTLVFFGATGDLAYKQIFPSLYGLIREGFDLPVIGVSLDGSIERLRERAGESLERHGLQDKGASQKLIGTSARR